MNVDEHSDLLAQLAACQERLAAYVDVVADVVERLGHEGREPSDLLDAFGEIEGMLLGKITNEPHDLAGLAEVCRQALWHRDRARSLLADARNTCEQRAAERDAAIIERGAAARELVRKLAKDSEPEPQQIVNETCTSDFAAFTWASAATLCGYSVVFAGRDDMNQWMVWCRVPDSLNPSEVRRLITEKL